MDHPDYNLGYISFYASNIGVVVVYNFVSKFVMLNGFFTSIIYALWTLNDGYW